MTGPLVSEEVESKANAHFARRHKLLIGGHWVEAASGKAFPVHDPATGKIIAQAAAGDRDDVDSAVRAARKAFDGPWAKVLPAQRAKLLWDLAEAIEANKDELAFIEATDNGKPFKFARIQDVQVSIDRLRYCSGWATKLTGSTFDVSAPESHAFTLREPLGVAGLIVPWNFPLQMAVTKIGAAVAAGCTVVLKPAEQTPLSAIRLGELIQQVGFPDGVVNIVTGFGETAGAALVEHPDVDKISFTGSTEVGRQIVQKASINFKRLTLELGGKSPFIIFPDADIRSAAGAASSSAFFNSGQVCVAGSRLFAHEKVFDAVVEDVTRRAQKLKLGAGTAPDSDLGPLISEEQLNRVSGLVDQGAAAGAKIALGGGRVGNSGYFFPPTLLTGTTPDMPVRHAEVFGPVLCAMPFSDDALEAIVADANDTPYGLSAQVFTRDLSLAHKIARRLRAGSIRVNGASLDAGVPFGGYKQSGWGREGGQDGIESYTELKSVIIKL